MSDASTSTADRAPGASERKVVVISSVALLLLLASLEQTIVATALPTIVADLGGLDHLSWVVTSYILASTVVSPLYGKLGDLYGRRNVVLSAVAIFLIGSLACGLATSMPSLIAARVLQGIGGGGLFVLAFAIIGDVVPPKERVKIQGLFAVVFGTSAVAGPLLGGWFVDVLTWHWIFIINLPLGLIAAIGFVMGFQPRGVRMKRQIDFGGAITLSVGLAALVIVTSLGGRTLSWTDPATFALVVLSIVSLVGFVWIESRSPEPILPLSLFRLNVFSRTSVIAFMVGAMLFGGLTFLPIYLQVARGFSPTQSGLQLIPLTIGILVSANLSGRYMGRTGRYRLPPLIGLCTASLSFAALTQITAQTPMPLFWLGLLGVGCGMGSVFPVLTASVQNAVPHEQMGTATAAGLMFRQIGGSVAVAAFGALFTARMTQSLGGVDVGNIAELGPQTLAHLPEGVRVQVADALTHAVQPIFVICAVFAVLAVLVALRLEEVPLKGRGPSTE